MNRKLTPKLEAELKALADLPDDQIDTSDIPEVTDWSGAKRGLYLPEIATPEELAWLSDMAAKNGYLAPTPIGNGRYAVIHRFMFTYGILTGEMFNDWGYSDRWCFNDLKAALCGLVNWGLNHYEGEPTGWHRHPDSGRRRPDGDPSKEYINR